MIPVAHKSQVEPRVSYFYKRYVNGQNSGAPLWLAAIFVTNETTLTTESA